MKLQDLNLLSFGNTIQLTGAIYEGEGKAYLCYFPSEHDPSSVPVDLEMTPEEWVTFLRQTDIMEVEVLAKAADGTITKALLRKSQRQIDAAVSWRVFKRDGYKCRYCGRDDVPLTVDHLVRWEEGGPTTEPNLLSACKKCNRVRGDMSYETWLKHEHYLRVSKNLSALVRKDNLDLAATLGAIPRVQHVRSR